MLGEVKEPKIVKKLEEKKEELAEDWLDEKKIKEKSPKVYETLEEQRKFLEGCTEGKKKEYSEELRIFEETAKENEFREVLVIPRGKEEEFTPGAFPLNFLLILEENLRHLRELKNVDSNFAKKGLALFVEAIREYLKGEALGTLKDIFKKSENFLTLEERTDEIIKKFDEETKELNKLRDAQASAQFVKKIKEDAPQDEKGIIEAIATFETFLTLIELGIKKGVLTVVKIDEEKLKKYLLAKYQDLEEKIINQIPKEMREKLKEKYFEKRKKESLPTETDYAA